MRHLMNAKLWKRPFHSQVIKEDVDLHAPMYEDIHQRGIDMLTRIDSTPDKHQLQMRLLDVENRWKNLKAQIDERQKNLGRLVPSVAGYMEVHEQVVTWLNESENKFDQLLSELSDVTDITVMADKQEQLKVQNCRVKIV